MIFQFNSDNRIPADATAADRVEAIVRGRLGHVSDRLSRVEVHVGDVNGPRGGDDIKCAVELRPNGMKPISATDEAASVEAAVASATDKALSAYDRLVGKQTTRKGH
jgi:hypothetical protein